MSNPTVLFATFKILPGAEDRFHRWKGRHDTLIGKYPGFISSDLIPSAGAAEREWILLSNFRSRDELSAWQKSGDHAQLLAETGSFISGEQLREMVQPDLPDQATTASITEVIMSKVKPGMDERYREWAVKIQAAQAKYPGYQGMYLQPPSESGGPWTTIIRYDSEEHLEGWLHAPERKDLLEEARPFIEHEELLRLATSFPGWVPIDPATGQGPPNWKTALLVLLGLFPAVMLEMTFLWPHLAHWGLPIAPATFFTNCCSVAFTSFVSMPLFVRWFSWWLFIKKDAPKNTNLAGVALLGLLFAVEIAFFWWVLPLI